MKCPYCTEEIQPDAKKCRFCKEWIEPKQIDGSNTEGSTGASDAADDLASVQALFTSPSTADAPSDVTTPSPSTAPVVTPTPRQPQSRAQTPRQCPHCGFAATTAGHFCGKCGKLMNVKSPTAPDATPAKPRTPIALPEPENTSGQSDAVLPPSLRKFNSGAFLWAWLWCLAYRLWTPALLCFVPGVNVVTWFVIGIKGNQWAWRSRRWESEERFALIQRRWSDWGMIVILLLFVAGLLAGPKLLQQWNQMQADAMTASSKANLQQMGLAFKMYQQDYDECFPPMTDAGTLKTSLLPYIHSQHAEESILLQPPTNAPYLPNTHLSGVNEAQVEDIMTMMLLYEGTPRFDGQRNVLFADGHVELVPEDRWQQIQAQSILPTPTPEPDPVDATTEAESSTEGEGASSSGIRTPDFDVPSLIGLSESQLRSVLGQALGRMQGNLCWENGSTLVAVRARGGMTIGGFLLIIPTDMTGNEDAALAVGNLRRDDPRYSVEVEHDAENNQSRVSVFLR